jgi:hypothetical protein
MSIINSPSGARRCLRPDPAVPRGRYTGPAGLQDIRPALQVGRRGARLVLVARGLGRIQERGLDGSYTPRFEGCWSFDIRWARLCYISRYARVAPGCPPESKKLLGQD